MPGFAIYEPNGATGSDVRVYVADKGKGEDNVPSDYETKRYDNNSHRERQLVITALKDALATTSKQVLEYGTSIDSAEI